MATVQVNVDTSQVRQLAKQARDQLVAVGATLDQLQLALKNLPIEMVAAEPTPPPVP